MKRFEDKPAYNYSVYAARTSGIDVCCPKCDKLGIVKADRENAYFKCTACGDSQTKSRTVYRYDVHSQCKECGRYYRTDIKDKSKQHFSLLYVKCPYCGAVQSDKVRKVAEKWSVIEEIKNGIEPYFDFPLYYQSSFDSKPVWAISREHLQYMIDYIQADVREKPTADYIVKKTQADHLPTFMKLAKNRDGMIKILRKMQTM
jgi:hypothetical protein